MSEPQKSVPLPPRGLLARRRSVTDPDGSTVRQDPPPESGRAPRPPQVPLPAGLLPLPPGFEPAPEVGQASGRTTPRISIDATGDTYTHRPGRGAWMTSPSPM
ncbi:hypothetical protein BN159_1245 [Streptomyces davaonensis JCM 4913]|uniref:Uncharacterized protein n=1 Tax=Streptomyces davaonensis (strain DSM 101723 / JCM 4913 / KCC S-0913 / 768) TaxID=1214101 RepID=K4QZ15_STRDJ|nr:hypothetical protein BN159_1245 [Streptomyces davaonensis JCM 4913]